MRCPLNGILELGLIGALDAVAWCERHVLTAPAAVMGLTEVLARMTSGSRESSARTLVPAALPLDADTRHAHLLWSRLGASDRGSAAFGPPAAVVCPGADVRTPTGLTGSGLLGRYEVPPGGDGSQWSWRA